LQQEVEMQVDNNATNTRYRVLAWKSKATWNIESLVKTDYIKHLQK
jgi:hypothetical protein